MRPSREQFLCLRKDFIVDEFQIVEAKANRADAILLIVAALEQKELAGLAGEGVDGLRAGRRPWARPSARRLCEILMVSPDHVVARDAAREMLFANLGPEASANALRRALSMAWLQAMWARQWRQVGRCSNLTRPGSPTRSSRACRLRWRHGTCKIGPRQQARCTRRSSWRAN